MLMFSDMHNEKNIRAQGKDFEKEGEVKPVTGPICASVRFACITVGKTIAIPLRMANAARDKKEKMLISAFKGRRWRAGRPGRGKQ